MTEPAVYVQSLLTGLGPPVLLPGQFTTPQVYAKVGQREVTGLRAYLSDVAPNGYVQISAQTGLISDGITDQGLQIVDVLAPGTTDELARSAAQTLAHNVRMLLSHSGRVSTRLKYLRDQTSSPIETGIWRVQQVYQFYLAFGQA